MYSQKNVLQVFVSPFEAAALTGTALAALPVGGIGLFDAVSNVSVTASTVLNGGYFAINANGVIKKSPVFHKIVDSIGDVEAFSAAIAHEETVTIPSATEGEYYQVSVTILANNHNGDEIKLGVTKAIAGDTVTTIADKIVASLNNALAREEYPEITVSNAAGVITIAANAKIYSPGRKQGGFVDFKSSLTFPEAEAVAGTVTVVGEPGIGMGYTINSKELFAQGNSDAVSKNEFRTAYPNKLGSSPEKTYNVLTLALIDKKAVTAYADVPTPFTIITAYTVGGGAVA